MEKLISVIGAFDRYNYGDLLFPHIMLYFNQEYLGELDLDMHFFGLRKYERNDDLQIIETESIKNIIPDGVIINAGGNTLNATVDELFFDNVDNGFLYKIFSGLSFFLGKQAMRLILRKKIGISTNYPYCIADRKVVYNSVGGQVSEAMLNDKHSKVNFDGSYVSVRDMKTYDSVKNLSEVSLVPDSAIVLSDMWNDEFLGQNVREEIRRLANSNYIVFQISKSMAGDVENLKKIEHYIEDLSCKVWLLPIGKVNSHGDLSILEQIYINNKEKCIFVKDIGLYDTTYIISKSKGFIGSSLHGNLISFSYGIPSILISNNNTKNRDYYDTWLADSSCIAYTLTELLNRNLEFKEGDPKLLSSHKKKVYENFERMASYICANL